MNESGGMMMAAMPKPEFIVAASIDTEKWLKLKAAPPLAMGLGLAMMQGISITEKMTFFLSPVRIILNPPSRDRLRTR